MNDANMTPREHYFWTRNAQATINAVADVRTLLKLSSVIPTWEVLDTLDCEGKEITDALSVVEAAAAGNEVSDSFTIRFTILNGQVAEINVHWVETDDDMDMTWAECKACGFEQERIRLMVKDVIDKEYAE